MQSEILRKIPLTLNRQLWITVQKTDGQIAVEFRVHHISVTGSALPTRQGFTIPMTRVAHLEKSLAELLQLASFAGR